MPFEAKQDLFNDKIASMWPVGRVRRELAHDRQTVRITLTGVSSRLIEQAQLHGGDHRLRFVRDPELE